MVVRIDRCYEHLPAAPTHTHSFKYHAVRHYSMFRSKRPRDILNEIKWRFDLRKCKVYYIHRGAPGDMKMVEGNAIRSIDRSFLILEGVVDDVYIPYHRIVRIDYEGTAVYMRKKPKSKDTTKQDINQNI